MPNSNHQQKKKTLRIIGFSMLICGGIFTLIGFIDLFTADDMPTKFWCLFVGFPLVGFGGMLTLLSFQREMQRYMKNEGVPIINETSKEIAPAISNTAQALREGFRDTQTVCECGERNEKDDNFCSACGKPLHIVCPKCGKKLQANDKFCSDCGEAL